jgi:hypothetical protein
MDRLALDLGGEPVKSRSPASRLSTVSGLSMSMAKSVK